MRPDEMRRPPRVSDYQKVALSVLLINSILSGMLLLHRFPVELSLWHRLETVGDGEAGV